MPLEGSTGLQDLRVGFQRGDDHPDERKDDDDGPEGKQELGYRVNGEVGESQPAAGDLCPCYRSRLIDCTSHLFRREEASPRHPCPG